ncbi:energy-coupling factor ABC transporter permease [Clostridium prolinivorans]|uniref:energy-coupling factor ABC transporter permease n=1 Tax=Clostridium prolinivorans TaxID=2769420 RepID=UPI000FD85398|nr:energy-coupling factor ABC transporter permease [Clostridium prolinivorans]
MHMADALLSPAVGGTMTAITFGGIAYSIKKLHNELDDKKIPLMGVMGAFVFAAQMINFSIPGTGSSGHIGGGLLLAILLGPYAGFLTMASLILIQALFFADGGLLAFGANVFNLGFYTCFLAYPLIYKTIMKKGYSSKRIFISCIISSIVALQLGAFSVVLETFFSRITELDFYTFILLMQPIHFVIGIIEGIITGAAVVFVWKARPELIENKNSNNASNKFSMKKLIIIISVSFVVIGGIFSQFASSKPDGLEWSIIKVIKNAEIETKSNFTKNLLKIQNKISFLPDYNFKNSEKVQENNKKDISTWLSANSGTSISGIIGGFITLGFIIIVGLSITMIKKLKG